MKQQKVIYLSCSNCGWFRKSSKELWNWLWQFVWKGRYFPGFDWCG